MVVVHRCSRLNLNGKNAPAFDNQQVYLGAGMCPPKEKFRTNQAARSKAG